MNVFPSQSTFVQPLIDEGQSAIMSLPNFYDTVLMVDTKDPNHVIRIPVDDVFLKYRPQFEEAISLYAVPRSMFYKPKTVSMDLYGTTEMWLALMRLNGIRNVAEFNRPMIKVYEPATIEELITIFFKREGKIT